MKYILALCVLSVSFFVFYTDCETSYAHEILKLENKWEAFKTKNNKTYKENMEIKRKAAWLKNCELIKKHNADAKKGLYNFTLADNNLADMTVQTYHQKMIKLIKSRRRNVQNNPEMVGDFYIDDAEVPDEIDWIKKGYKLTYYNQKDCGSCYAFSIATAVGGQYFKQNNETVTLSTQQIVECSTANGNLGCGGGSLRNTLRYLESSGGLMTSEDYPYTAKQSMCKFNGSNIVTKIISWSILPARNEKLLKAVIGTIGPVAASINASPPTFQLYKRGVYDDSKCSSNTVNHAVLVYGYTKDYWLIQNWWGRKWGENGTMRLRRNKNMCGISNYVAYVVI